MEGLLNFILLLPLMFSGTASGFKISRIAGPSVIVNGSVPLLVLDCQYDATRYDTKGLTVKWYLKNRMQYLVYQWIPNTDPQALSILKGRVDLRYRASNHSHEMYRALAILNPTTTHSGDYTCAVSTFQNDDFKTKKVVIYAPATDIFITYNKPSVNSVTVTCVASGLYPQPIIQLFTSGTTRHSTRLPSHQTSILLKETGTYNASAVATIGDSDLQEETVFECRLTIPGTDYRLRENILYYPGVAALESTSQATAPHPPPLTGSLAPLFITCFTIADVITRLHL